MSIYLLGMRAIAIKLADPFGTNRIDFDLEAIMCAAYSEAVAQLSMQKQPAGRATLPDGMMAGQPIHNPILNPILRAQQESPAGRGSKQGPFARRRAMLGRWSSNDKMRRPSAAGGSSPAAASPPLPPGSPLAREPPAGPGAWRRPQRARSGTNDFSSLKRMQTTSLSLPASGTPKLSVDLSSCNN